MTLVAKHMTSMTANARRAQDTPKTGTAVGVWNNESIPVTRLHACQPANQKYTRHGSNRSVKAHTSQARTNPGLCL